MTEIVKDQREQIATEDPLWEGSIALYANDVAGFVENMPLESLVAHENGRTVWAPSLKETAEKLSLYSSMTYGIARSDASNWSLNRAHKVAKGMQDLSLADRDKASEIRSQGFELGVVLGLPINLGNRQISNVPLGEDYKEILEVLPFTQPGMLEEVISHTLAQYKEGLRAIKSGKVQGVVTQEYLDNVAKTFAHVGNRSFSQEQAHAFAQRADGTVPLAGVNAQKFKLQMLIMGYKRLAAQGVAPKDNPFVGIGRAFELPDGSSLDISMLVRSRLEADSQSSNRSLQVILEKVDSKEAEIKENPRLGTSALVGGALAASIAFGGTAAAAAAPNGTAATAQRSTVAKVQTFTPIITTVGKTPTSINAKVVPVTAAPVNVETSAPDVATQRQKVTITPETAAPKAVDPEDPVAVAELALQEGTVEAAKEVIQNQATEEVTLGNDDLKNAMKENATQLRKRLEGGRGEKLSPEYREQILRYVMYIESAADNPSILKKLEPFRKPLVEGKALGKSDVVEALLPDAKKFFDKEPYKESSLTPEDKEMLAALWANGQAQLMTEKEIEAVLPKVVENYDERPNDVSFGESQGGAEASTSLEKASQKELLDLVRDTADKYNWSKEKSLFMQAAILEGYPIAPACLVCGAAGNAKVEGAGYNANINEFGNAIGFGLYQWSFERRTELEAAAKTAGIDLSKNNIENYRFQVAYAKKEMKKRDLRDGGNTKEWDLFITIKDPGDLADQFRWNFERPEGHDPHGIRSQEAESIWSQVKKVWGKKQEAKVEEAKKKATEETKKFDEIYDKLPAEMKQRIKWINENVKRDGAHLLEKVEQNETALEKKYGNGKIPKSELVLVDDRGHYMSPTAALAFEGYNALFKSIYGRDIEIGGKKSAFRTIEQQEELKRTEGDFAAEPGTSRHGVGKALDVRLHGGHGFNSDEAKFHKKYGPLFGFYTPYGLGPNSSTPEAWHLEFFGDV